MAESTLSLNSLLKVLRDRDIPYDRESIKSAFDNPESQSTILAWMQEFLSSETMLTKEEVALYTTLSKNSGVDSLASQDLSVIRGLKDQEIQDAVDELKRSTVAIEKQTEALRLQQNAMNSLVKNNARNSQARGQRVRDQQRKLMAEKGQISTAMEELSHDLEYQISDLDQQLQAAETAVKQTVESILRSDDKLLSSLQKLASDLDPKRDDDGLIGRIKELCTRLIKHTVEGIRTKLDRIYLDALENSNENSLGHDESQEVADLQEELESLYSEILPVAQMSAEQQYLGPALREVSARDGQGQNRSTQAVKYIADCLTFLVDRIEIFLQRAEEYQCHKMALGLVTDEAKIELLPPTPWSPSKLSSPVKSDIQKRRKSSSSKSPVRARNPSRRSSGHLEDDLEPEQQLLRNLGVSIPAEATSDQTRSDVLEKATSDRISKLEAHVTSVQSTTESSISCHLQDAQITLQLLCDSLLTESPYHQVQLLDPEIISSVDKFEQDVQALQERIEAVNLQRLQTRSVHKEQLIERWSR